MKEWKLKKKTLEKAQEKLKKELKKNHSDMEKEKIDDNLLELLNNSIKKTNINIMTVMTYITMV